VTLALLTQNPKQTFSGGSSQDQRRQNGSSTSPYNSQSDDEMM
jgi:hypothetical protein